MALIRILGLAQVRRLFGVEAATLRPYFSLKWGWFVAAAIVFLQGGAGRPTIDKGCPSPLPDLVCNLRFSVPLVGRTGSGHPGRPVPGIADR